MLRGLFITANSLSFILYMHVACRSEERPGQMEAIEG